MGSSGEFSQILLVGQKLFRNPCFMISFLGRTGVAGVNLRARWPLLKPLLAAKSPASLPLLPSTEPLPQNHAQVPSLSRPSSSEGCGGGRWNGDQRGAAGGAGEGGGPPPASAGLSRRPPRTRCCGLFALMALTAHSPQTPARCHATL